MFAAPPIPNLLVLRSPDIHRLQAFYLRAFGMSMILERHGNGPEHYSYSASGFVLELYPLRDGDPPTTGIRFGLNVDSADALVKLVTEAGGTVVSAPRDTAWGRRAVIKDLDGHTVELLTPPGRDP